MLPFPRDFPACVERRRFALGLVSMLGSGGCSRQRPMTKRIATMNHDTWVLWPEADPPAGGWPILLFLHGQGEAAWKDDAGKAVEQGPDALFAHNSPVALYRAKDGRVKTLWQSFVLIAPQAVNEAGVVGWWDWSEPEIKNRVVADVERVVASGRANRARLSATGFSRGGRGCFRLDADTGPLQFRKIAAVDAQGLDALPAVVQRRREVRAYYAPSSYEGIRDAHQAAEKRHGKAKPPVSIIARPQPGRDGAAHTALGSSLFLEDELYGWLLA
jgi:hypothetical protein